MLSSHLDLGIQGFNVDLARDLNDCNIHPSTSSLNIGLGMRRADLGSRLLANHSARNLAAVVSLETF